MAKPPRSQPSGSEANLLWATVGLIACALVTAAAVAFISNYILNSFQDTNAMVMLITDAGTKSDDKNLEKNLSAATMALKTCRDLGLALAVGCFGVGVATSIRLWRRRASTG
jgi:hypothetical protein